MQLDTISGAVSRGAGAAPTIGNTSVPYECGGHVHKVAHEVNVPSQ